MTVKPSISRLELKLEVSLLNKKPVSKSFSLFKVKEDDPRRGWINHLSKICQNYGA